MDNILKALYDRFYCQPDNTPQEERIKANHLLLRQRLSKRNRKLVPPEIQTFGFYEASLLQGTGRHSLACKPGLLRLVEYL